MQKSLDQMNVRVHHAVSDITGVTGMAIIRASKKIPSKLKGTTTSRVATALRMAVLSLRNSKTALGAFYRRISRRKGASVAVFATAPMIRTIV